MKNVEVHEFLFLGRVHVQGHLHHAGKDQRHAMHTLTVELERLAFARVLHILPSCARSPNVGRAGPACHLPRELMASEWSLSPTLPSSATGTGPQSCVRVKYLRAT